MTDLVKIQAPKTFPGIALDCLEIVSQLSLDVQVHTTGNAAGNSLQYSAIIVDRKTSEIVWKFEETSMVDHLFSLVYNKLCELASE